MVQEQDGDIRISALMVDMNGVILQHHGPTDMLKHFRCKSTYTCVDDVVLPNLKEGNAKSMSNALRSTALHYKDISLRQVLQYVELHIEKTKSRFVSSHGLVNGFDKFVNALYEAEIPLGIISTSPTALLYAFQEVINRRLGEGRIHSVIGNYLEFGDGGESGHNAETEVNLREKIKEYFSNPQAYEEEYYDFTRTTGKIEPNEDKLPLILNWGKELDIFPERLGYVGDSISDELPIREIAKLGGLGIAFNHYKELEQELEQELKLPENQDLKHRVKILDLRSPSSNLMRILPEIGIPGY